MIEFRQVGKAYQVRGKSIPALYPTDLWIKKGEIFGLVGHSGAGKSTLLRLINRLEEPTAGTIIVDDQDVTAMGAAALRVFRRRAGMIFQHFNLLSARTVAENVGLPLKMTGEYMRETEREKVSELLVRVGLQEHADKYPAQLSGGQKQRVGIARALATDPKILLCDEATSALDPQTTVQVLQLLSRINQELGLTIVLITHEMEVVRRICDRVAVMDDGRIVEQGNVVDVFLYPQHETTRHFVREAEHVNEEEELLEFNHVAGHIIRITFSGETTYTPLVGRMVRDTGIEFSILSGRIDRIKNTPYGQLILSLAEGELDKAVCYFEATQGIHYEVLR